MYEKWCLPNSWEASLRLRYQAYIVIVRLVLKLRVAYRVEIAARHLELMARLLVFSIAVEHSDADRIASKGIDGYEAVLDDYSKVRSAISDSFCMIVSLGWNRRRHPGSRDVLPGGVLGKGLILASYHCITQAA